MNVRMSLDDIEDFISARNAIWEPLDEFHISPAIKLIEFHNTDNPYKEQPIKWNGNPDKQDLFNQTKRYES